MITFELSCHNGHRFEGWFANRKTFDEQLAASQITCPLCNSTEIEKRLSAVSVYTSKNSPSLPSSSPSGPTAAGGGPPGGAPGGAPSGGGPAGPGGLGEKGQVRSFYSALSEFVEKNFEDVGEKFAEQAIKMQKGEVEDRSIRGTSSEAEDELMKEEGVEFSKMALPKYDG
jgi:hypothetical protein